MSLPFKAAVDNVQYVGTGSDWKYLDGGVDPGEEWVKPSFNDNSWATGAAQLGYGDEVSEFSFGDDSNNKDITYYFRKTFAVDDASSLIKLKLMFLRDDGGLVHINGAGKKQEKGRSNKKNNSEAGKSFCIY